MDIGANLKQRFTAKLEQFEQQNNDIRLQHPKNKYPRTHTDINYGLN